MTNPVLVVAVLLLAPSAPEGARAVPEKEAKVAIATFDTAPRKAPALRLEALRALSVAVHPLVADRLLRLGVDGDEESEIRNGAFVALVDQKDSATRLAPALARYLAAEAKESRRALAKGDFGIPMDKKTGDPILDTEEGKAALAKKRARGKVLASSVALLRAWGHRSADATESVRFLLQDGTDELVVEVLRTLGSWKDAEAMHALLELFEMYPTESKWETGASVDRGGTNASAKAAWMGKFGDPDKRRARPVVVKAMKAALLEITGQALAGPADLAKWMASKKVGDHGKRR